MLGMEEAMKIYMDTTQILFTLIKAISHDL